MQNNILQQQQPKRKQTDSSQHAPARTRVINTSSNWMFTFQLFFFIFLNENPILD